MHQRKSKKVLFYFFLLTIISSITNTSLNNFNFDKEINIKVSGLSNPNNQIILEELKSLNLKGIFLINKKEIIDLIDKNSLVEKYEVAKLYPSTIEIKVYKTKLLAKINNNGKIFFIGSNGKLILNNIEKKNLPFIFGKPKINEFLKFKTIIDQSKLSYNQIENIYYFPSKRWDLKLKDNILLKLPNEFTKNSLDNAYEFIKNYKLNKFTVVDFRVNNQIIVYE
tara:strand:+ start:1008 stop:1679 length:672 start_codon:yes stop_codon:yes gene_type:complete